jgi:predicted NAD/FAD-binding protein
MKIAIVGSGISGLVCAHLLHQRHEVTVFEADSRIGGHTSTVDVHAGAGKLAVDTGFIVYNERTYPNFVRLLGQLGIETQPSEMSFSVSDDRRGLEWGSRGWNGIFAQRRNIMSPEYWRMLGDVMRFNREARQLIDTPEEKATLGAYLCGGGYSEQFVDHYIVPMGAAIWSADPAEFLEFPAVAFVRFLENHGLLERKPSVPWRVIRGGSRCYVDALVAPFRDRVQLSCPVISVERRENHVAITTADQRRQDFDHVIMALHSDQALRVLSDANVTEQHILGAITYQENDTVLHTDASIMPKRRNAWASWNYRIPESGPRRVFVSYHMNRLQNLECDQNFFVTLNGSNSIDERLVIERFTYHHPVFNSEAIAAQRERPVIDGVHRTHFCGAYWGYGFHEDGVKSALTVCERFGARL